MFIHQLILKTNKLNDMKKFYVDDLGMILVSSSSDAFTVQAGASYLTFENTDSPTNYHFAFSMYEEKYDSFIRKLASLTPKLVGENGVADFASGLWKCKQTYFLDPQGNIIEFLANGNQFNFVHNSETYSHIIEIGLPVPNIAQIKTSLSSIQTIYQSESETFSFYGGADGAFVLVKVDRPWFPTTILGEIHPIKILVKTNDERFNEITFNDLPYSIQTGCFKS